MSAGEQAGAIQDPSVDFSPVIFSNRSAERFVAPAIAALLLLMVPELATAHAELETSTPADGATVPSPFDGPIVLDFSAALANGSKAELIGPHGPVITESIVGPGARMTITPVGVLAPGDYEVKWTSVAEDADVARGTIEFTVAPAAATASPSPSPSGSVATPLPSASEAIESSAPASLAPSASPGASPVDGDASSSAGDVLLPIVAALIIVGAGAVYLLYRRNRPTMP